MAKVNPFRFSTKFQDDETDISYYSYRYYNASTGRWLSRDPLNEQGGNNLYEFVKDNPLNSIDADGRVTIERDPADVGSYDRCSSITLYYKLSLSKPPPHANGYLVQHLTITQQWQPCDPKDTRRPPNKTTEIWEDIGSVQVGDASSWSHQDLNSFMYSPYSVSGPGKGLIQLKREVNFFEATVTGDLPTLWSGGVPGFVTSPATSTAPSWWSWGFTGYEPEAKNTWSVTFNCCCPGRPARFHDTAGGPAPQYNDN